MDPIARFFQEGGIWMYILAGVSACETNMSGQI